MKNSILLYLLAFISLINPLYLEAQNFVQENNTNRKNWGDQGNGTYINPVLDADYSDPDVIRVGDDFYMVCS